MSYLTTLQILDAVIVGGILSPSQRHEAPCEGTNPPRLFTPRETKAIAKSKVHK